MRAAVEQPELHHAQQAAQHRRDPEGARAALGAFIVILLELMARHAARPPAGWRTRVLAGPRLAALRTTNTPGPMRTARDPASAQAVQHKLVSSHSNAINLVHGHDRESQRTIEDLELLGILGRGGFGVGARGARMLLHAGRLGVQRPAHGAAWHTAWHAAGALDAFDCMARSHAHAKHP